MTLYSATDILNSMDRAYGSLTGLAVGEPIRTQHRFIHWVRTFLHLA